MEQNNNNNNNNVSAPKIVPSYKNKDTSKEVKSSKPKKKLSRRSVSIFTIIFVILIILAIVGIGYGVISLINYFEYKDYYGFEKTMDDYAFSEMYNNKSPKSSEHVTKSELVKMVLSATFNMSSIDAFADEPEAQYENAIWVEYAQDKEIIGKDEITQENENDKATYIEAIRYLVNTKSKILEKDLSTEDKGEVKDIENYTPDEKNAILDMVNNKIITIKVNKINGSKKLTKAKLNEMIINYVREYNTITVNGDRININKEKEPSNAYQYPYTLANIDKSVYELAFYNSKQGTAKTPIEVYKDNKELFSQVGTYVEDYLNTILNVDYNTINAETFKESLSRISLYTQTDEEINEYVNYVKSNQIKTTGSGKVQFPCIYYDGSFYRVRTEIIYKIESVNELKNIFYKDLSVTDGVTYEKNEDKIIIDIPISKDLRGSLLFISIKPISTLKAGNVTVDVPRF